MTLEHSRSAARVAVMTTALTLVPAAHGTRGSYDRGCRCPQCRRAVAAYNDRRDRLIAYGRWAPYVDAEPVRAHLRMLAACGLGRRRVAQLSGVPDSTLCGLLYGAHGTPSRRTRTEIAQRILAVRPRLADVHDRVLVDGTGTRRRLRALYALGFTSPALAARLGTTNTQMISRITARDGAAVYAATARAVIALYDRLWDQDPAAHGVPAGVARRAARDAARRGWVVPMAWDDDTIDDPAAQPDPGTKSTRQTALAEDAEFVAATGVTDPVLIARRLGVSRDYLEKALERERRAQVLGRRTRVRQAA